MKKNRHQGILNYVLFQKNMDYNKLATREVVTKTAVALKANGVEALVVENSAAALEKIKELIPQGASVMNGSSATLEQIGYIDYLASGKPGWNNLKAAILAEKEPAKQQTLRLQATLSDYYLGSVHALTETGEFIIASNTGSQLSHIVFTSPNLIFVVSTKKIVPTLAVAFKRLEEYVFPIEDKSIMEKFQRHTMLSKIVIFKRENKMLGRKVRLILVNEDLGF